jgi:hypothetical protein
MWLLVGSLGGLLRNRRVGGGDYGISIMMVDGCLLAYDRVPKERS